jgi:hypothetical protein
MNPKDCTCSVCGSKPLRLTSKKYQFETLSDHCTDPNKDKYPLRGIMVCTNPQCKSSGKGFWSVIEGGWYSYNKSDPELVGIPLSECNFKFGDQNYPADLWVSGSLWKENDAKYNKGIYVGENLKSKFWRKYGLLKNDFNMWRFRICKK